MANNSQIFEKLLYDIIKTSSEINIQVTLRKIKNILIIKKAYLMLKKKIDESVPKNLSVAVKNKNVNCCDALKLELDKMYNISLQLFKSFWWGEFRRLNPRNYGELYSMMVNQNGDLLRSYDDFLGTVAVMDFHGYTQFSKDIKYNKTPLQEFGDILPQKIEAICTYCKSIVYEMEGDALIIIGPENPVYILNAVMCIIELCRQKPLNPNINPKTFHKIDINNPMIKPFELNASVTTGGRVFINRNGHIIGSLISEASRILKIINTKKPNKSGIVFSEKLYRKIDKYKTTNTNCHLSIFDYDIGDAFMVDVKGTRLHIREVYLEKRKYIEDTREYTNKITLEIKKKNPSKWLNILSYYMNLIISCLSDVKLTIQIGNDKLSQDKLKKRYDKLFYDWIANPNLDTIKEILKLSSILYEKSEEIRDVIAVYHEFVQENYNFISKRLEEFYENSLLKEGDVSPATNKVVVNYRNEIDKLKTKFPEKRIIGKLLSTEKIHSQLLDIPYMGKK